MAYTTINKPDDYFNTVLYTGTGASNSVTGVGFQPDWVWVKRRDSTSDHTLGDVVRGTGKKLWSNLTGSEGTDANFCSSFNSDGFTVAGIAGDYNGSGATYASWNWKANGAGVSNTAGTIASTVSANTTSGFSIVSYTGTGSAGATIGHGLGAVPRMIMVKNRDAADAWQVYHAANTANPETDYLVLNTTAATADALDRWNDTLPTSTLFSIGDGVEVNTNTEDYIAYCFAEKKGYSSFGKYLGNGDADGTFIYTGFRPAFTIIKRTDSTNNWMMFDNRRSVFNVVDDYLVADGDDAEAVDNAGQRLDFLSNGFKIRNSNAAQNASGGTYIYIAFAENPFVTSTSIPTTAR